ncbi:MAG: hypothetical protein RLZZ312_1806 [Bacteroidota bacterium]|jgi:ribosomal protein S18 acetylase RimI-like enzyme
MTKNTTIIGFEPQYANVFETLNIHWLEKHFEVEPIDQRVLSDPQTHILDKGGHIFFAKINHEIAGTVALIKSHNNVFELSKMAVSENFQSQGIGKILIEYCFDFAKQNNISEIILYSNTKLEAAIHLYKKMGFTEIPVNQDLYKRANIKMKKIL